jgi:hypothetical protein
MGTLRGDNGGNRPPDNDGPPEGVPDLPPEWGVIVIPDDPADLAAEAARVRRAFRRQARQARWRRRLRLPSRPGIRAADDSPALAVPLLIMSIAVIATLTSLFAVAWPAQPGGSGLRPGSVASAVRSGWPGATGAFQQDAGRTSALADVTVADSAGSSVRIGDLAPAVLLFVDGCECASLLRDTLAVVGQTDPAISVVAVTASGGTALAVRWGLQVLQLVDAAGALRAAVPGAAGRPGTAAALLIAADATVAHALPVVATVEDLRAELARLIR